MKLRVYVDTSVIGGCFDIEFKEASQYLLNQFKMGVMIPVISDLTLLEISNAPQKVQGLLQEIPDENIEYIELNKDAADLAQKYISENIIGEKNLVDAQHIAMATVYRVDILVSWNFQHIVNLKKIRGFNSVNLKFNYPLLEIRTPRSL